MKIKKHLILYIAIVAYMQRRRFMKQAQQALSLLCLFHKKPPSVRDGGRLRI